MWNDDCRVITRRRPPGAVLALGRGAQRVLVVAVIAVALAACGSSSSAVDGPVMRYPDSSGSGDGMDALVSGVLVLDGDCLYVARDGERRGYPVLWPSGTTWNDDAQAVVTPAGEMLPVGDEVAGGGGYLYLGYIERVAGTEAAELARECLDNTTGEIAVFNNSDSAVGPS